MIKLRERIRARISVKQSLEIQRLSTSLNINNNKLTTKSLKRNLSLS